ncbi:hypothetical protein K1719_034927 [Acacia pycnantha]|nr:hypothetical protein K1719_034927 [Acacia pycnantha]
MPFIISVQHSPDLVVSLLVWSVFSSYLPISSSLLFIVSAASFLASISHAGSLVDPEIGAEVLGLLKVSDCSRTNSLFLIPLIPTPADVVTALTYLASQRYDPNSESPQSSRRLPATPRTKRGQ